LWFAAPKFAFLDNNFMTRQKIDDSFSMAKNRGQGIFLFPPHATTLLSDELVCVGADVANDVIR